MEHINVGLLCSLCRPVGWQLAGIIPSPESDVGVSVEKDSLNTSSAISPEHRKIIGDLLFNYYSGLVQHAENACMEMNIVQKRVKRQERTRGDAAAEEKAKLETCRAEFEKLKLQMIEMSNSLGVPVKIMNEEPSDDEEDEMAAMEMDKALAEGQVSLWPDEETRVFYENILDIRSIVPKNLYKESEEQTVEAPGMKISIDEIDLEGLDSENAPDLVNRPRSVSPPLQHEVASEPAIVQGSEEVKQHMQKFLVNLDHLVNRDFTDETALDFGNRKRLVKVLFASPPSRLDLLPFYARLVASLSPVMPDVSAELTNLLIKQFK
uniref:MIF4G domain-containing protein n=1 Tax=Heterorhabditis bacteriophora TaxID=37862 RepID=A0A1I7XJK2_HETBA